MSMAFVWFGSDDSDTFIFRRNLDNVDEVHAGAGDDVIADGRGRKHWSDDYYYGEDGNDHLISRSGNDYLDGGSGDDTFTVRTSRFNAGAVIGAPAGPADWRGFDVTVVGGCGHDVLTISNSRGSMLEVVDDVTYIHTRFGGLITVTGVEEFHFV